MSDVIVAFVLRALFKDSDASSPIMPVAALNIIIESNICWILLFKRKWMKRNSPKSKFFKVVLSFNPSKMFFVPLSEKGFSAVWRTLLWEYYFLPKKWKIQTNGEFGQSRVFFQKIHYGNGTVVVKIVFGWEFFFF